MDKLNNRLEIFEDYINKYIEDNKNVGISAAIIYKDEIIFAKGFGNRQLNPDKIITPNTMMSIQSITKSFASTAIMHLVEKGLIDLDLPLVHYLPYFQTKNKEVSDSITVRHILSHTAGFPGDLSIANMVCINRDDFDEINSLKEELGITEVDLNQIKNFEDITRYFKHVDLAYKPGEGWKYCTDAYVIVGDLFEKVSGLSWHHYVQDYIFNKIGMSRSTIDPMKAKDEVDSARYYVYQDSQYVEAPYPMNPIAAPIGFIYSTAIDMAKYLAAHMHENRLLKFSSIYEMQGKYANIDISMPNIENVSYGLGWANYQYKGIQIVGHSGGYIGVKSNVSMVPDKKLGIVILSNYHETNPEEICLNGIDILLNHK